MIRLTWALALATVVLAPVGVLLAADSSSTANAQNWDAFVQRFLTAYFRTHPDFAVNAGRHEFDGQLPDWSLAGLEAVIDQLREARTEALRFEPERLKSAQRFEREYLLAFLEGELFWREAAQWPQRNPFYYANMIDPNVYVTRPYAPLEQRLRAFNRYAKAVPRAVEQIQANLQVPLPQPFADIGQLMFGGLASFLSNDVARVFGPVQDAELQAEFARVNPPAGRALQGLADWCAHHRSPTPGGFALGPDRFREMLRATERVDVPLRELEALGREDLERNLAALRQACAAYAPGKSVAECLARVKQDKPKPGPLPEARQELAGLKQFVLDHAVVSVPGAEVAKVEESPPYQRWNFAYIDIPGPYDKGLPSIYYIAPPDPHWSAKEREAYIPSVPDLLFTSVHEVWPGHFLQFLHANRVKSPVGRVFLSYAYVEGWAHYAEEMMWEAGLGDKRPEMHIGQLLNALLRNVRFLSALGLHTGSMTLEESERRFREEAFQDPGTARQQAARGTFDPAYLNYTLGKLMIRRLRQDWLTTPGTDRSWRAFHDQFLSYGGPPIPLVRQAMLGTQTGDLFGH